MESSKGEISKAGIVSLHPTELEELEGLAANNFTLREMAAFFLVDYKGFKAAFEMPDSIIKRHYDKGKLQSKSITEDAMRKNAEGGNITAYQIFEKKREATELEELKESILYQG